MNYLSIQSIFSGFGIYTIIFILLNIFINQSKKESIKSFDNSVCTLISIYFFLYLFVFIFDLYSQFKHSSSLSNDYLESRVFGEYWFGFWIQPIFFSFSQLLWISKIRNNKWVRLLIGIIFLASIEKIIIYLTSLQREYLPSSWSISYFDQTISWIFDLLLFLFSGILFHFIRNSIKNRRV